MSRGCEHGPLVALRMEWSIGKKRTDATLHWLPGLGPQTLTPAPLRGRTAGRSGRPPIGGEHDGWAGGRSPAPGWLPSAPAGKGDRRRRAVPPTPRDPLIADPGTRSSGVATRVGRSSSERCLITPGCFRPGHSGGSQSHHREVEPRAVRGLERGVRAGPSRSRLSPLGVVRWTGPTGHAT